MDGAIFFFPLRSSLPSMMTERQTLVFMVGQGLRKGLGSIRLRKALRDDEVCRITETIVEVLEGHNWKITLGEPGRPPG
jgi:hypothetical protein